MENSNQMPEWAKTLMDQNRVLADKLNAIENGRAVQSRKATLERILEKADKKYRERVLKFFDRMTFKGESDFNQFVQEIEADIFGPTGPDKSSLTENIEKVVDDLMK